MKPKAKKKPSPDELLAEVQGQAPAKTYEFEDYIPAIHSMLEKDYSYASTAEFLKERLGITVSRGQVYRAHQIWLAKRAKALRKSEFGDRHDDRSETLHDEVDQALRESAIELIQELYEGHRDNSPDTDPYAILRRAVRILESRRDAVVQAEKAAEAADAALAAKKEQQNAPTK